MKKKEMDLVNRYLDGELDPTETVSFEERLNVDHELRACLGELRSLDVLAGDLEVFTAPRVEFTSAARPTWYQVRTKIRPLLAGVAVAAACLLIGVGIGVRVVKPPVDTVLTETFRIIYYAPGADTVSLLGDFNGWAGEIPLKPRGADGYWLAELSLQPGEYRYIMMVDGIERPGDPLADYVIDDDFGSKNSVVRIGL